jgi:hypothetical protein
MDKSQQLAAALHSYLCKSSHVDQCDWDWHSGDWGGDRAHWLKRADRMLLSFTFGECIQMIAEHRRLTDILAGRAALEGNDSP